MYMLRFLLKRKNFVRFLYVLAVIFCVHVIWLYHVMRLDPRQSLVGYEKHPNDLVQVNRAPPPNNSTSGGNQHVCKLPVLPRNHSDTFTYDLQDITEYNFVKGKRFKEYAIPVKSEQVAYGPDLEHVDVFLVPFSHVDPGYGNTMEGYYSAQTRHTLSVMVDKLHEYRNFTFQWAETVFLERWWRDIDTQVKDRVRELVRRGQLEIVLGSWVMPDEAITHYGAIVDQLVEGHQWVVENLGVIPRNSWSNDPFGYSSTMPYLWKRSGIDNMVILRINQALKGTLMKRRSLEFTWQQYWSGAAGDGILCHVMPYRGYWIGDVCGPYNQHICREYAFHRTEPVHKVVFVTKENVAERARILYEQYRITAELYQHNALYIALGEDFSFTTPKEYDLLYTNYEMLFNYINAKPEWKMNIKFGTLAEYFKVIRADQDKKSALDGSRFPTLSGDFFPYTDYQNDFWTGYYTTRPFNKQLSRELQSVVRAADIFNVYAYAFCKTHDIPYTAYVQVARALQSARRELGMFMHHDGITGTSVQHVMNDFQNRLYKGLVSAQGALRQAVATIVSHGKESSENILEPLTKRANAKSLTQDTVIHVTDTTNLLASNPTGSFRRRQVVSFTTSSHIAVETTTGEAIDVQLSKNAEGYKASFVATLHPFGITTYKLKSANNVHVSSGNEQSDTDTIIFQNTYIRAEFDSVSGLVKRIVDLKTGTSTSIHTELLAYTSKSSGAYLFGPAGEAQRYITDQPRIHVSRGTVVSAITAVYNGLRYTSKIYHVAGTQGKGVHMQLELNMNELKVCNREVIVRFKTDMQNKNTFFTDQNGFQLLGRKTYEDRPIEQNYYPITSMVILEDETRRLTLHTGQPHGVASLKPGWVEAMLDRCVSTDDNKGLGAGVTDNKATVANFILQTETKVQPFAVPENRYTYPTKVAILVNDILLNPVYLLISPQNTIGSDTLVQDFAPMQAALPCGVNIVGLRNLVTTDLKYNRTSLILHRNSMHCGFHEQGESITNECASDTFVSASMLFGESQIEHVKETSLTHLIDKDDVDIQDNIVPMDMELRAFIIDFGRLKL